MSATTPFDRDRATQSISAALRALERELTAFGQALAHSRAVVSLAPPFASASPMETVATAYGAIDYAMEDEAHVTVTCVGVVGAPATVIEAAEGVNIAKAQLRAVCAPLHKHRMRIRRHTEEGIETVRMSTVVRVILASIGRSDLNLIAAYRRIPILEATPTRIAFTRTLTRKVRRVTRQELFDRLQHAHTAAAAADRDRLLSISDGYLALAEPHSPNVRANVWYRDRDARSRDCVQLSAELPLLFRTQEPPALPEIGYPTENDWLRTADSARRPRQTQLEAAPWLGSLPAYRYLDVSRKRGA
jgi:hypothetical protein